MSNAPVLVAEGLTKRYGGLVANDGVAMTLAAGEIRGLQQRLPEEYPAADD